MYSDNLNFLKTAKKWTITSIIPKSNTWIATSQKSAKSCTLQLKNKVHWVHLSNLMLMLHLKMNNCLSSLKVEISSIYPLINPSLRYFPLLRGSLWSSASKQKVNYKRFCTISAIRIWWKFNNPWEVTSTAMPPWQGTRSMRLRCLVMCRTGSLGGRWSRRSHGQAANSPSYSPTTKK